MSQKQNLLGKLPRGPPYCLWLVKAIPCSLPPPLALHHAAPPLFLEMTILDEDLGVLSNEGVFSALRGEES